MMEMVCSPFSRHPFQTADVAVQVMGRMPDRFARAGARAKPEFFKEGARLAWPAPKTSKTSKKEVRSTRSLQVRSYSHALACKEG